jgi:DNA-binding response OmpR family regulator
VSTGLILIAQQDPLSSAELEYILGAAGFNPQLAVDGIPVIQQAASGNHALILLDVNLPLEDGLAVCCGLRRSGMDTPIVFVTSNRAPGPKVRAFEYGADEYIARPFDPQELALRIRAIMRRCGYKGPVSTVCRIGASQVDLVSGTALRGATSISLTNRETELLRYLCSRPGRVVSREELLREVWQYTSTSTRTVDVHLCSLRQKLEADARKPQHLLTVRQRGYKFHAPSSEQPQSSDQQC